MDGLRQGDQVMVIGIGSETEVLAPLTVDRTAARRALDDALSAVDTATEASIFDGLLKKLPETTIVLISHRISTVRNCDRIKPFNTVA